MAPRRDASPEQQNFRCFHIGNKLSLLNATRRGISSRTCVIDSARGEWGWAMRMNTVMASKMLDIGARAQKPRFCRKSSMETFIVPTLAENTTHIDLTIAKPKGLSLTQLGVPLREGTVIKKGTLPEFIQLFEDGKAGRRFQNIRITAVKTREGDSESAKLIVQFEVFGDENVPVAANSGFGITLCAGTDNLVELPPTSAFLPYADTWYENHYVYDTTTHFFDQCDRLQLTLRADQVRMI
jgi:hypothetical protein